MGGEGRAGERTVSGEVRNRPVSFGDLSREGMSRGRRPWYLLPRLFPPTPYSPQSSPVRKNQGGSLSVSRRDLESVVLPSRTHDEYYATQGSGSWLGPFIFHGLFVDGLVGRTHVLCVAVSFRLSLPDKRNRQVLERSGGRGRVSSVRVLLHIPPKDHTCV